jgi:hypothetical protein
VGGARGAERRSVRRKPRKTRRRTEMSGGWCAEANVRKEKPKAGRELRDPLLHAIVYRAVG